MRNIIALILFLSFISACSNNSNTSSFNKTSNDLLLNDEQFQTTILFTTDEQDCLVLHNAEHDVEYTSTLDQDTTIREIAWSCAEMNNTNAFKKQYTYLLQGKKSTSCYKKISVAESSCKPADSKHPNINTFNMDVATQ